VSGPGRDNRAYLAICGAMIGWALGYAIPGFAQVRSLYYDPLARRFLVGMRPGLLPMGYYGQILWGAAGAIAGLAIALAIGARRRAPDDSTIGLAGAWALTALLLVGAYFTWNNWP